MDFLLFLILRQTNDLFDGFAPLVVAYTYISRSRACINLIHTCGHSHTHTLACAHHKNPSFRPQSRGKTQTPNRQKNARTDRGAKNAASQATKNTILSACVCVCPMLVYVGVRVRVCLCGVCADYAEPFPPPTLLGYYIWLEL